MNDGIDSPPQVALAPGSEPATPSVSSPPEWLIVGLDVPDLEQARPLVRTLAGRVGALKIGPVLFTRAGPAAIDLVHEHGGRVFLDLKWHDIPNTVAGACRAAAALGVWMVNVHAAGGERMLAAAREALEQAGQPGTARRPLLIAVTVLTSLDAADLPATGVTGSVAEQVERLAALAERGGADGLVTSGHEVAALHARWPRFNLVVPGVRPRWLTAAGSVPADDQRRIVTPAATLAAGASHVVIARPIITHPDPADAVHLTVQEVAAGS
jgi:orotidine-5'-phosphate decarboxylase